MMDEKYITEKGMKIINVVKRNNCYNIYDIYNGNIIANIKDLSYKDFKNIFNFIKELNKIKYNYGITIWKADKHESNVYISVREIEYINNNFISINSNNINYIIKYYVKILKSIYDYDYINDYAIVFDNGKFNISIVKQFS